MPKNNEIFQHDDLKLVTDLKTSDRVLMYGNSFITGMSNNPKATTARRGKDLTRLSQSHEMFERIYVTEDVTVSDVGLMKLTAMNAGLLVFFLESQQHEQALVQYFSVAYPWHEVWVFDTNCGRTLVTDAKGAPKWLN